MSWCPLRSPVCWWMVTALLGGQNHYSWTVSGWPGIASPCFWHRSPLRARLMETLRNIRNAGFVRNKLRKKFQHVPRSWVPTNRLLGGQGRLTMLEKKMGIRKYPHPRFCLLNCLPPMGELLQWFNIGVEGPVRNQSLFKFPMTHNLTQLPFFT